MKDSIIEKIKNKHIAILGFGKEGQSTYEFIKKYLPDTHITIIDKEDKSLSVNNDNYVDFVYGDNYLNNLEIYDLIIKTPGISLINIDISAFKNKITSQMELFLECNRDNVIGITGTKGKSTTTSLIYSILKANNIKTVLAGNIGTPVFAYLDDEYKDALFVLEMSSHQLEYLNVSPHIAIVLNLFQDHLDHAGSIDHYYASKMNIFAHQTSNDIMLYYLDNKKLKELVDSCNFKAQKYSVSLSDYASIYLKDDIVISNDIPVFDKSIPRNILGNHNFINIMFAYKVSELLKLDKEKTLDAIKTFQGLEYRLQKIGVVNDVEYYVDTLATIPQATLEAINAIPNINTLIFGGKDRKISYDGFAEKLINSGIKHFICMPETGHIIAKELPQDRTFVVDTLEEAVELAKRISEPNTVCILSPAAASYGHFKNYQDKAEQFKNLVLK